MRKSCLCELLKFQSYFFLPCYKFKEVIKLYCRGGNLFPTLNVYNFCGWRWILRQETGHVPPSCRCQTATPSPRRWSSLVSTYEAPATHPSHVHPLTAVYCAGVHVERHFWKSNYIREQRSARGPCTYCADTIVRKSFISPLAAWLGKHFTADAHTSPIVAGGRGCSSGCMILHGVMFNGLLEN